MQVLEDLTLPAKPKRPSAITIGSFDGVHIGHQQILAKMRELAGADGSVCVITFSNHPSHVLKGFRPVELILPKEQKLKWLDNYGVDITYCVEFTPELAGIEYDGFLSALMDTCPFDYLVLGKDAHLGKKRGGSPEKVRAFLEKKHVEAHYLDKLEMQCDVISSRKIRELLRDGERAKAIQLLGHPL